MNRPVPFLDFGRTRDRAAQCAGTRAPEREPGLESAHTSLVGIISTDRDALIDRWQETQQATSRPDLLSADDLRRESRGRLACRA